MDNSNGQMTADAISALLTRAALALFVVLLFTQISAQVRADDSPRRLRVLTYNIKHGYGMDDRVDLKRAAALINRLQPDLVALQEIDNRTNRTGGVDQAARIGELTKMRHAFGSFFDYQGGQYGLAILSRQPLREVKNHRLPRGAEPRSTLTVAVRPRETGPEIVFVSVHFYRTEQQRLAQAKELLEVLKDEKRPVIVAGDFNSTPDSPVLKLFHDRWTIPDKGQDRFTFPSVRPDREIDYILFRPKSYWKVAEIDVLDEPLVSDHRPVLADLTPRREKEPTKQELNGTTP